MTNASGLTQPSDVVEAALAASRASGCVVIVHDRSEAEVRFANSTTTSNGVRRSRRVTVVSTVPVDDGVAAGVASRSGAVDVEALVRASEAAAHAAPPADDAAPLLDGTTEAGFDARPEETDLSVLRDVLAALPGAFERAARVDAVLAGFAHHAVASTCLGTSTGLRRRHVLPVGTIELVARADGGANSAWVGAGTRDFADVAVDALAAELERRLAWGQRRVELPAGRYDVVLPPSAVADLALYLGWTLSGTEAEEGRSVFSRPGGGTRVGERLSPLAFELRSDPAEPGLDCDPFLWVTASSAEASVFDNGLALARTEWIRDGRLQRLYHHRAGAVKLGVEVGVPGGNLALELPGATGDVESLREGVERGLLLTCLWYIREVDPATLLLTGLTRDGVYLVEHGEVTGAVNNFRFNESPVDLLARATHVGAMTRTLGREFGEGASLTAMPALRVGDFNMSSVSPAS